MLNNAKIMEGIELMLKSFDCQHYGICIVNNIILTSKEFLDLIIFHSQILGLLDQCFLQQENLEYKIDILTIYALIL